MTSSTHTWQGFSGPAPLASYPGHAVPLDGWDVGMLMASMRDRYLHLTDASRWPDATSAGIASSVAAGVKLCLDELETACRRAAQPEPDLHACYDHEAHDPFTCTVPRCDCDGWSSTVAVDR